MRRSVLVVVTCLLAMAALLCPAEAEVVTWGQPLYQTGFEGTVGSPPDGWTVRAGGAGDPGWHIDAGGDYRYSGSGTGLSDYTGPLTTGASGSSLTDFVIEAPFRKSSALAGLVARLTASNSFYHARLYGNNLQVYDFPSIALLGSVPVPADKQYQTGETWSISMAMFRDQITARLVDDAGEVVAQMRRADVTHTTGSAGFRGFSPVAYEGVSIRGFNTYEVTTADGNGADSYVELIQGGSGANSNYGGTTTVKTKNAVESDTLTLFRKSYLRFDLSEFDQPLDGAALQLTAHGSDSSDQTFNVFGLLDGHARENWGEGTITYANAPANTSVADNSNDLTADAILLGTFTGGTSGTTIDFASLALTEFIEQDTDDLVTFIITRQTLDPVYGGAIHEFRAKEYPDTLDQFAPRLTLYFSTPEPATLSLLAAGALCLLRRRKRA